VPVRNRFINVHDHAPVRPAWVAISPSRISRRPIRASKVAASSAPMSALPVRDQVGQQMEGTPGLGRIDHRRGIICVPEPDARANTGRNRCIIGCGYRKITGMRELAALQGSIDQLVAKDVSRDDQGHHICRPGRQQAHPIKA